ncbi:MAG: flagellar export protein FliJ [Phormidesmis sp.]
MTIIKKITDSLPNEHVVAVSPPPEDRQNFGRRRLNLFTGRALSHRNLQLEQTYRSTHLALLGQQRSAGVVEGLEAAIARRPIPIDPDTDRTFNDQLAIAAGIGLSLQGEELRLPAGREVRLGDLPVYAPPEVLSGADTSLGDGNNPLEPRRLGDSLQVLVEAGRTIPSAGVVLLQPITTESSGAESSSDPCTVDVAGLAFANRQLIDGARLIFYTWPTEWLALPVLETPPTDAAGVNRWRSQLAYAIFRRELMETMPWGELGVPIALLGFDANWRVLFSDRYAVVRQGGRARHRPIPVSRAGNPFLWQARIEQFAEQLGELDLSQIPAETLADYFAWLPPVGGLPNYLIENLALPADGSVLPGARRQLFFPTGYRVEAAPIPEEQLDLVFRESASLLPYDTISNDASSQVKLLVPVPQKLYDPDLLKVEIIDSEFNATLTRFVNQRAEDLHRRQLVRDRASVLHTAIAGEPLKFPDPDPNQLESSEKANPDEPFASPSAHQSAIARGLHEHGFRVASADSTLAIQAGDRLLTYVYLDPNHLPTELMLTFQLGNDSEHRAYWGGLTSAINRGIAGTASRRRLGERPSGGEWVRLEIPLTEVGLAAGNTLTGMVFTLYNGRAAWGHTARLAADGSEQVWVGTAIPAGGTVLAPPEIESPEPWLWLTADERLTPFEDRYAIEEQAGVVVVTPIETLKIELRENSPLDRDAVRVARLGSDAENEQLATLLDSIPDDSPVDSDRTRRLLRIQGALTVAERDRLIALAASSGTTVRTAFTNALGDLFRQSQDNTTLATLDNKGLEGFIQAIEALTNQADDQIEFGFLQVRTDMYRIRQFVLGNEEASRLSISPTLGAIAQRDTAAAAQSDLSDFFKKIKAESSTQPVSSETRGFRAPTSFVRSAFTLDRPAEEVVSPVVRFANEQPIAGLSALRSTSGSGRRVAGSLSVFNEALRQPIFEASTVEPVIVPGVFGLPISTARTPGLSSTIGIAKIASGTLDAKAIEAQSTASQVLFFQKPAETIIQQSPLVGKVNQSITIAERLQDPPAPEARNYTLAGRVSVIGNLASSDLFKDIPVPGGVESTFGQIKQRPGDIAADPGDLPDTPDEGEYFSSSVRVLDNTVAALRLAEGRIAAYRQVISRARQTLKQLQTLRQQAESRLNVIGSDLAEARHDVSVARALIAEEQQRLDEINQKRQKILETQVPFLVYHRPRTLGPDTDIPVRGLLPSVSFPARPACLNRSWPLPDALQEATELLRQSPISWLPRVPCLLKRLDRPEILLGAIQQATFAARQPQLFFMPALQRVASQTSVFAQAITRTVSAQQQAVSQYRVSNAQLDTAQLSVASWQQLRDHAKLALTLGDLIDGKHTRSSLSRAAAKEFEDLTHALGCLYAGFSDIRPIIRLVWAERLSQYDSPINLRNFSSLPRWGEIDYLVRRELQSVADWLYLRVSANQREAIALINDLVRICILLASAAPVDQIITGRIVEPTPASKGGRVSILIDPVLVHIGMSAFLYGANNRVVAEGIVEDLTANRAAARITQTVAATVQLAANTQVRFLNADNTLIESEALDDGRDDVAQAESVTLAASPSANAPFNVLGSFSSSPSGNFRR